MFLLYILLTTTLIYALPEPPQGMRWAKVENLTDQFDSYDEKKWRKQHPHWKGRSPSQFNEDNVLIEDGYLKIKGTLKDESRQGNFVWTGCFSSQEKSFEKGMYSEVKMKAAELSVTSSFWMSNAKDAEIDVIENWGRVTNQKYEYLLHSMEMNSHYYAGGRQFNKPAKPKAFQYPDEPNNAEQFAVFGVWWKDADTLIWYRNGEEVAQIQPKGPFNDSMYMLFDMETMNWGPGLPKNKNLKNDKVNTAYFDYVKTYQLTEKGKSSDEESDQDESNNTSADEEDSDDRNPESEDSNHDETEDNTESEDRTTKRQRILARIREVLAQIMQIMSILLTEERGNTKMQKISSKTTTRPPSTHKINFKAKPRTLTKHSIKTPSFPVPPRPGFTPTSLAQKTPHTSHQIEFDFTEKFDLLGWTASLDIDAHLVSKGILTSKSNGPAPYYEFAFNHKFDQKNITHIKVKYHTKTHHPLSIKFIQKQNNTSVEIQPSSEKGLPPINQEWKVAEFHIPKELLYTETKPSSIKLMTAPHSYTEIDLIQIFMTED